MGAPTFFLIHGAWAGPWIWEQTAVQLAEAGHKVVVADPLGQSETGAEPLAETFETTMARLRALADRIDGPLIVVGHSGGGVLGSALAQEIHPRIATLVYVAGFMLPSRTNYSEIAARQAPGTGIGPHLVWNADRTVSRVPISAALDIFFHDCDSDLAKATARRLSAFPEAVRSASPVLTKDRFGCAPRVYFECIRDRSIPLAAQREMQDLVPGARRVSLPCGHAPMLALPDTFSAALAETGEAS